MAVVCIWLVSLDYTKKLWLKAHVESIIFSTQAVEKQVAVYLCTTMVSHLLLPITCARQHTCGLIKTRSMNSTTKSCSTYLSPNRLHRGHCVNRTPLPKARSSALL